MYYWFGAFIIIGLYYKYGINYLYIARLMGYISIYTNKLIKYFKTNDNPAKIINIIIYAQEITSYNSLEDLEKIPSAYPIEIEYNLNNKNYYFIYTESYPYSPSKFPIYSLNDLVKKPFSKTDDDIILVTITDKQLESSNDNKNPRIADGNTLKLLKKFSGPKGNFYADKLQNNLNFDFIIESLIAKGVEITKGSKLEIMMSDGEIIRI